MKIVGTKGDDALAGKAGDDVIKGRAGDDILMADGGLDILKGGKGADTFVIPADGFTFIKDFKPEQGDKVIVSVAPNDPSTLAPGPSSDLAYDAPLLSYKGALVAAFHKGGFLTDGDFLLDV